MTRLFDARLVLWPARATTYPMKGVASCLLALLGVRVQGFGYFVGIPEMDMWEDVGKCMSDGTDAHVVSQ